MEAWSPPKVLEECGLLGHPETLRETNMLYNSMIHPLTKFTIKGVLWYQGKVVQINNYLLCIVKKTI